MRFTKKILTMATCAVMAASSMVGMSASAGFGSSLLKDAGTAMLPDGTTYHFKNGATISTTLTSSGLDVTGTVTLYERDGLTIPSSFSVIIYADLYLNDGTTDGILVRSKIGDQDDSLGKRIPVSVEYTGSSFSEFYCKGTTQVEYGTTYETNKTAYVGA